MTSPTPRTDGASKFGLAGDFDHEWWTPREVSRALERDLLAARAEIAEQAERHQTAVLDYEQRLAARDSQIAELRERVIEECAKFIESPAVRIDERDSRGGYNTKRGIAAAIRALAKG